MTSGWKTWPKGYQCRWPQFWATWRLAPEACGRGVQSTETARYNASLRAQELYESWSGCPGLPSLINLVSVDLKQHFNQASLNATNKVICTKRPQTTFFVWKDFFLDRLEIESLRMHLWWILFSLYLLACQVRITVGDSGLCCCVFVWRLSIANG